MPNPSKLNPVENRLNTNSRKESDKKSVIERISNIEFGDDDGMKILLYGRPGTGKTTLAATFPGPILWVICSGSKKNSGELLSVNTEEYRQKIKKVELFEVSELWDIVQYVAESEQFKTIVVDHVSGLQDLIMKQTLGLDEIPVQKAFGIGTKEDWSQIAKDFKQSVGPLLDLKCNVVLNSQERVFKNSEDSEQVLSDVIKPLVGAAILPAVNNWLNWVVNYVAETCIRPKEETFIKKIQKKVRNKEGKVIIKEVEEQRTRQVDGQFEYYLRTGISDSYQTKFRVTRDKKKPTFIADPSYEKIRAVIEGKI